MLYVREIVELDISNLKIHGKQSIKLGAELAGEKYFDDFADRIGHFSRDL